MFKKIIKNVILQQITHVSLSVLESININIPLFLPDEDPRKVNTFVRDLGAI